MSPACDFIANGWVLHNKTQSENFQKVHGTDSGRLIPNGHEQASMDSPEEEFSIISLYTEEQRDSHLQEDVQR